MTVPLQTFAGSATGPNPAFSFTNNITPGNGVVVVVMAQIVTSAVTPASGGDTYALAVGDSSSISSIWYVLASSGGYKQVTLTNATGGAVACFMFEVPGLTALDRTTSNNTGTGTTFTSGTTAATTQANEFWVGEGWATLGGCVGPSSPWVNSAAQNWSSGDNGVAGYQFATATGTATYSGTCTSSGLTGGAIATFKWTGAGSNDLPRIAPGPTWLEHFKPGMPRPRPLAPPPPLDFSTQPNLSDIPQAAPGPMWLARFKSGLLRRKPPILLPPAPKTTASLAARRPSVAVAASAKNPVFPRNPLLTKTEVLINGTWLDVTRFVYQRNNMSITRGLPDETQTVTPASLTLTLNNRDGRFSPGNPLGAFYPYLTRNVQLRVSLTALSTTGVLVANSYRFWGEVSSWPPRWDSTGTDIYCDITVSGPLRRYVQGAALGSTLRQYYTSLAGNFVPVAYWPAEDGSSSGEIASALSSAGAMTYTGAPGFASNASFGGSDPLPVISSSIWHGTTGAASSPPGTGSINNTVPGLHQFTAPPGVTAVTSLTSTGAGAGGGDANGTTGGGGGGGGGKGISASVPVTGGHTYNYFAGTGGAAGAGTDGGDGQDSYFTGDSGTITGKGGKAGKLAGAGGAGGIGDTRTGGAGAAGASSTSSTFNNSLTGFAGSAGSGSGGTASHQTTNWTSPITGTVSVSATGSGGGGQGGGNTGTGVGGGGGGGGASGAGTIDVTAGNSYTAQAGNGGNGGPSAFKGDNGALSGMSGDSQHCLAGGGAAASGGGNGGSGGTFTVDAGSGTNGSTGGHGANPGGGVGGGGGGGAGTGAAGQNASGRSPGSGGGAGSGGGWGTSSYPGSSGSTTGGTSGSYGGGGGGGGSNSASSGKVGGGGGPGNVQWSWTETGVPAGGGAGSSAGSAGNGNAGSGTGTGGAAPTGGAAGGSAGSSPSGSVAGGGGAGGVPDSGDGALAPGAGASGSVAFSWSGGVTSPVPANIIRFCLDVDSAGAADGAILLQALTYGTVATLNLVYHTGGKLELIGKDISNATLFDSGQISFSADGTPLYVDLQLIASGANITWVLSAIVPGATSVVTTATSSVVGSVGNVSDIFVDPAGTVVDNSTTLGQITVQSYADTLVNLSPIAAGFAGELAADRILRLCTAQGLGFKLTGTNTDTPQMGAQQNDTFVNLIQSCADVDRGQAFETRDAFGIGYRTRVSMQGQNPVLTADYSAGVLSGAFQPTADDQHTRNLVTVTRNNGASAVTQLSSGTMSTATPPAGVGIYSYSTTVQAFADTQLANLAAWILTVGTVDEYRYPTIEFDLTRSEVASFIDILAALDIGDFIQVSNPPQFLQATPVSQLAFGFTEILNALTWGISINTVPESPYSEGNPPTW